MRSHGFRATAAACLFALSFVTTSPDEAYYPLNERLTPPASNDILTTQHINARDNSTNAPTFRFPLPNGFPHIPYPSTNLTDLEILAQGTPPQSPPPHTVSNDTLTTIRLVAFSSLWDVAFLSVLTSTFNTTSSLPSTSNSSTDQTALLSLLNLSTAQSQIHAISANEALKHLNSTPILPCTTYTFSSLSLAPNTSSSSSTYVRTTLHAYLPILLLRIGTLATMQTRIAMQDTAREEAPFVGVLGGLIASLGARMGALGAFLEGAPLGAPSPLGGLGGRGWELEVLRRMGWVDGECVEGEGAVGLGEVVERWVPLEVKVPEDVERRQQLEFSLGVKGGRVQEWEGRLARGEVMVVYVNQQNEPFAVNVTDVMMGDAGIRFGASFPYQEKLLNGLTVAVLVNSTAGSLETVQEVEAATAAGPALVM